MVSGKLRYKDIMFMALIYVTAIQGLLKFGNRSNFSHLQYHYYNEIIGQLLKYNSYNSNALKIPFSGSV